MKKLLFVSFLTVLFFSSCASIHENEDNRKKGNEKWLRFVIEYSASKWLFINKYTFKIDDEIETITPEFNEIKRDVLFAEHIYETLDCNAKWSIYRIASKIANSKRTLLRCHGEQHISDRELTKEEIQGLKTILEAYEKL